MEVGGCNDPEPNPKPAGWSAVEQETRASGRDAAAFVERHSSEPFFYHVPFSAPHHPLWASPEVLAKFSHIKDETRRTFAAAMSEVDDAVGAVLKALRKHDIEDNTLIFFISDNGAPNGPNGSFNTPYSGFKMQLFEGGIHVPYLMQWKAKVPAGRLYNKPVIQLDVAATACAAAGVKTKPGELDGVDLTPFVNGQSGTPHDALYWRTGARHAARAGNWKLLKTDEMKSDQLFDLSTDPGEKHDLAATQPAKLKEMQELYAKWDAQMAKPLWEERVGGGD
jgi:arylsulfatase A-like enzyme